MLDLIDDSLVLIPRHGLYGLYAVLVRLELAAYDDIALSVLWH